jgi:hypothetical protein
MRAPLALVFGARLALACLGASIAVSPAPAFTLFNTDLVGSFLGQTRGVWGWSSGGHDYALLCRRTSLWVVDVTQPSNPTLMGDVPSSGSGFLEVRTYDHYAYAVNNVGPLQIIDLSNPANIRTVATFQTATVPGAHTIEIDGHYAYLCLWGVGPRDVRILDLTNPTAPVEVGSWRHPDMPPYPGPNAPAGSDRAQVRPQDVGNETGEPGLQAHDCYIKGNRLYVANLHGGFAVVDITDKTHPTTLALVPYDDAVCHSMWGSEDGNYLYTADEHPGGHLRVWRVTTVNSISQIGSFETAPDHIIHNVYVRGRLLYAAYYTDGLRVLDISSPSHPVEIGYYDTFTGPDGGYLAGAWGAYPWFSSNNILVSDTESGLFVVHVDPGLLSGWVDGFVTDAATGSPRAGATLRFPEAGHTTQSGSDGYFKIWLGEGRHTMIVDSYGYWPDTSQVDVPHGGGVRRSVAVTAIPFAPLRLRIQRIGDGLPVEGAVVIVPGLPGERRISDATGLVDWGSVPQRDYTAQVGRFGYVSRTVPFAVPAAGPGPVQEVGVSLFMGFLDNASTDQGWSLSDSSDDATGGQWVRDDPNSVWGWYLELVQPDYDADGTQRGFAFHTGYDLPSWPQELADVDSGRTTLTSPVFRLAGILNPTIFYSRWFSNDSGAYPDGDPFRAEISNDGGQTWTLLEEVTVSERIWMQRQFLVRNYLTPTNLMRLRFIAGDYGNDSVVEAAVDRIGAMSGATTDVGDSPAGGVWLSSPAPNPAPGGAASISFRLPQAVSRCRVDLLDVRGRVVSVLADGPRTAGNHELHLGNRTFGGFAPPAGLYWIRLSADGRQAITRLVVVSS